MGPAPLRDSFAELVRGGDDCNLARAALAIARIQYTDLDPAPALATLDGLAAGVAPRIDPSAHLEDRALVLARYLFDECGFRGNTDEYYDPRNSFLNDVLERRTGIPISLSLVFMETGARVGLAIEGVGFPGHFLVRVTGSRGPLLLDPFCGGSTVGRDELLERLRAVYGSGSRGINLQRELSQSLRATGHTGMLVRMLGNLLNIYLGRSDYMRALQTVELLLVLEPSVAEHLRVRGALYERLECFAAAREDLEHYLRRAPDAAHAGEVRAHLARLGHPAATVH